MILGRHTRRSLTRTCQALAIASLFAASAENTQVLARSLSRVPSHLTPLAHQHSAGSGTSLVPKSWLVDANPPSTIGAADLRQPKTPVYQEIKALKEGIVGNEAAGRPTASAKMARLAYLLGVPNATSTDGGPAKSLADLVVALKAKISESQIPTQALHATFHVRISGQNGGCGGYWCWANLGTQTSEPTSDPQNEHPTTICNSYGCNPNTGFFAYLCGPGATTEVVSNWIPNTVTSWSGNHGTGPQSYMLHMGDLEMTPQMPPQTQYNSYGQQIYSSAPSTITSVINQQIGTPWYVVSTYQDDGTWASQIHTITADWVPTALESRGANLIGWGGSPGVYHEVTVSQEDYVDAQIKYYDTAGAFASGSSSTLGMHNPVTRQSIEANQGMVSFTW